jgi:predicted deacylase
MRHLQMLPERKTKAGQKEPLVATSTSWIRAPSSGIVRLRVKLGQRVDVGQSLATISDPMGDASQKVEARFAGIVIGQTNLPLVHEGDALMHIARFDSVAQAESRVDEFQTELQPDTL